MEKGEGKRVDFEIKDVMLEDKGWRGIFRFHIEEKMYGLLFIKNDYAQYAVSVYHIGKDCPFCAKENSIKKSESIECVVLNKHSEALLNQIIHMPTIRLRWLLRKKRS